MIIDLVHHSRVGDDDECESLKFIGAFISQEDAKNAIKQLKDKRGFNEYPNGFTISEAKLGEIGWTEGFMGTISDEAWENWGKDS